MFRRAHPFAMSPLARLGLPMLAFDTPPEASGGPGGSGGKKEGDGDPAAKGEEDPVTSSPAYKDLAARFQQLENTFKAQGKELDGFRQKEKERTDAEKTELQREKDRAAELEAENKRLKIDRLRDKVANHHKLPEAVAELLRGETEEELEAHAKTLAPLVTKGDGEGDPATSGGAKGGTPPTGKAAQKAQLESQLKEAQEKGDVMAVLKIQRELSAHK